MAHFFAVTTFSFLTVIWSVWTSTLITGLGHSGLRHTSGFEQYGVTSSNRYHCLCASSSSTGIISGNTAHSSGNLWSLFLNTLILVSWSVPYFPTKIMPDWSYPFWKKQGPNHTLNTMITTRVSYMYTAHTHTYKNYTQKMDTPKNC